MSASSGLRFAVGTPQDPVSAIWRVWSRNDDVYMTARVLGGLMKLSLHGSGVWVMAFAQESGVVDPATGNRRVTRWTRPQPFLPGWTHGPALVVPHSTSRHLEPLTASGKPIIWLDTPSEGHKRSIQFLFADPSVDGPGRPAILPDGLEIVGRLHLRTSGAVFVMTSLEPLTPEDRDYVADLRRKLRVEMSDPAGLIGVSALPWGDSSLGVPLIWEILLGPGEVQVHQPEPGADS